MLEHLHLESVEFGYILPAGVTTTGGEDRIAHAFLVSVEIG